MWTGDSLLGESKESGSTWPRGHVEKCRNTIGVSPPYLFSFGVVTMS